MTTDSQQPTIKEITIQKRRDYMNIYNKLSYVMAKTRIYMREYYKKNKEKWDARTNRYRNTKRGKEYVKEYNQSYREKNK